ncbi:MAG: response regulator [Thermodesulfobacteriota bacterium]
MADYDILEGKRILVVDDEPDVLDAVREALDQCRVTAVEDFSQALDLINRETFDLVVLDIMGVRGFELLEACRQRRLPAAMLTARAINVESLNRSIKGGALSFLPKEELGRLRELIAEILQELSEGRRHWTRLFARLGPYFREKLGVVWADLEKPPVGPPLA